MMRIHACLLPLVLLACGGPEAEFQTTTSALDTFAPPPECGGPDDGTGCYWVEVLNAYGQTECNYECPDEGSGDLGSPTGDDSNSGSDSNGDGDSDSSEFDGAEQSDDSHNDNDGNGDNSDEG